MNALRAAIAVVIVLSIQLCGCQFSSVDKHLNAPMNTCAAAAPCSIGTTCMDGLCVADESDAPLDLVLKVTPVTPMLAMNQSDPLPMFLERFTIHGTMQRDLDLPTQVLLHGTVRVQDATIAAEVSFTPIESIPGLDPSPVATSTNKDGSSSDFSVSLLRGVEYRMLVRPTDPQFAPYHRSVILGSGSNAKTEEVSVDYSGIATLKQTFVIVGGPTDRTLLVRALDPTTGVPISSTGTPQDGEVTLVFAPDSAAFILELRAGQSYDQSAGTVYGCDFDTPAFPTFTIPEDAMQATPDGKLAVMLPGIPTRIRYEGTVTLCKAVGTLDDRLTLPISLHSRSLVLDQPSVSSASAEVTTKATVDRGTGALHFCAGVMPGEYDVVVTPPASVACGLFAEKRFIQAPDMGKKAIGALLELPEASSLKGALLTSHGEPMDGVSVEAVSLGRSSDSQRPDIELPANDPRLTRYNRTRQTTTNAQGEFDLPVDLGSYDVLLKPPALSGYPWLVRHDVRVGPRAGLIKQPLDLFSPVALKGALHYPGQNGGAQASLRGAQIEAFAIVANGPGAERALPVGKTMADDSGHFTLLLPPSTVEGW